MKEFEEFLSDYVIPYEDGISKAQEAREILSNLLRSCDEGPEAFFQALAMLDMVENMEHYFIAWTALKLVDLEFIPIIMDEPFLLQGFCRSQACSFSGTECLETEYVNYMKSLEGKSPIILRGLLS